MKDFIENSISWNELAPHERSELIFEIEHVCLLKDEMELQLDVSLNFVIPFHDLQNIKENLKKEIQLPIKIRNDAKCAAIAENKMGALKDYKRSIFLSLGTGIGGAVIINNELLDTGDLSGCEFGHMIIQKDGIRCNCGKKGCFEKYASMKALKTNLRDALGLDENTRGQELLDMLRKNKDNYVINKIVDEYIEYLSIGISNLIDVFEPEAVCLGGSFVYFADVLLEKLKNNIQRKKYLFNIRKELIIIPAALGNDAGIIGSCQ